MHLKGAAESRNPFENVPKLPAECVKIDIPGYPDAFNPSLTVWQGRLLLSFREHTPQEEFIGLVWLNDDLSLASLPQILNTRKSNPGRYSRSEDARLFTLDDRLYIFYNDNDDIDKCDPRRMYIGEISFDGDRFDIEEECFSQGSARDEKNWSPFAYKGELLFVYSHDPVHIMKPILGQGRSMHIIQYKPEHTWKWGDLRGGTPALLVDGEYLTFFHAHLGGFDFEGETLQRQTVMGALTFSAHPPFRLKKISKYPLIAEGFYGWPLHLSRWGWGLRRNIFPGGFVVKGDEIYIAYGKDDHEVWIVKFKKKDIYENMVSC